MGLRQKLRDIKANVQYAWDDYPVDDRPKMVLAWVPETYFERKEN